MANLRQLAISTLSLAAIVVATLVSPANAGGIPVSIAPIAPSLSDNTTPTAAIKGKLKANIAQAAICTEDLSQISFSEYTVDWTRWMSNVANRWAVVFNNAYAAGKFRPDGPAFVQFTCNSDGSVGGIQILSSSGDVICDETQVATLKNCVPLPAFPVACKKQSITVLYVWDFGIDVKTAAARRHKRLAPKQHAPLMDQRISITGKLM